MAALLRLGNLTSLHVTYCPVPDEAGKGVASAELKSLTELVYLSFCSTNLDVPATERIDLFKHNAAGRRKWFGKGVRPDHRSVRYRTGCKPRDTSGPAPDPLAKLAMDL